eukprot:jgi/Bigna1/56666/estExt_Genewise1Plus.C_1120006
MPRIVVTTQECPVCSFLRFCLIQKKLPDLKRMKWRPAEKTSDEEERIAELKSLDILDTEREEVFDSILWLATMVCETGMGAISFVDKGRQWFKSQKGLDVDSTGRDEAFCAHAIHQPDKIMVVPNALEDDRFAENPLVTGGPKIRFYASMPVTIAGRSLGTLCVIDDKAKTITETQKIALNILRDITKSQLLLRKKFKNLKKTGKQIYEQRIIMKEEKKRAEEAQKVSRTT